MNITNLPFEIIEHINSYLLREDRYQLIYVDQSFHKVFIRLLYRTVVIESKKQFEQLIHNFEETKLTSLPYGHCVYNLEILLDELSEFELKKIQALCPFIKSIYINWHIWKSLSTTDSLPPFAHQFYSHYKSLSGLKLDLKQITTDNITNSANIILSYTPYLRSLTLMGINQYTNISLDFIEYIHQLCPYIESLSLDGYQTQTNQENQIIKPNYRLTSFELSSQYGADRYQDWLPFICLKYPNLTQFKFSHTGNNKDIIEPWSMELYHQFFKCCQHLTKLHWKNTSPDFTLFQVLDQLNYQKLIQLHIIDNLPVSNLLTTCLFESKNDILKNVTQLEFGPLPRDMKPNDFVQLIAKACPKLNHLTLQEPNCNLSQPFRVDIILNHFQSLLSLKLVRIPLRLSYHPISDTVYGHHPLEKFTMEHCSSFDGVFEHISNRCPNLKDLDLFAFTQRDRRYKVQIHLPNQNLKRLKLHSLRTETFDIERRIRFFSIQQQQDIKWYYMHQFDSDILEITKQMIPLNQSEIYLFTSLINKPLPSEVSFRIQQHLKLYPQSIAKYWNPKDIYDTGYVDLICNSIQNLHLNKKWIPL